VRFEIEQRFTTNPHDVLRALSSERYLREGMGQLPDISEPEVTQIHGDQDLRNVLTFRFNGNLPSVVTSVIDTKKLSWVEDTTITVPEMTATFTISPAHYAHYFGCQGTWTIAAFGNGSTRVIKGSMKVNSPVPFVGGQVERAIVSGLRERLALEPAILDAWVRENPS
jgi:hypothetical protein